MIDSLLWVLFRAVLAHVLLLFGTTAHELGHYFAARCVDFPVAEVTIGFGPVLFTQKVSGTLFQVRLWPNSGNILCNTSRQTRWTRAFVYLSGPCMEILSGVLLVGVEVANHWNIFFGVVIIGIGAYSFVQFEPNSDVKKALETLLDEDVFLRSSVRLLFRVSYGALIFVLFVIDVFYDVLRPH